MTIAIKICGVTRPEDAAAAAALGATHLGLNFWPRSRRFVTVETARAIAAAVPAEVRLVGVFVNAALDEIEDTVTRAGLHLAQLHGDEEPGFCERLAGRYLRALPADRAAEAALYPNAVAILVDTPTTGYGGAGVTFDWSLVEGARGAGRPLFLAGGLGPGNVAAAVRAVRPDGVDVASGVESAPGIKDLDKMRDFIAAAREAARP